MDVGHLPALVSGDRLGRQVSSSLECGNHLLRSLLHEKAEAQVRLQHNGAGVEHMMCAH